MADTRGWRTMETAPRDGTPIDLWVDGQRYPDCRWQDGWDLKIGGRMPPGWWFFEAMGEYSTRFADPTVPESRLRHGSDGAHQERLDMPTHWMPLPAPPEDDAILKDGD